MGECRKLLRRARPGCFESLFYPKRTLLVRVLERPIIIYLLLLTLFMRTKPPLNRSLAGCRCYTTIRGLS